MKILVIEDDKNCQELIKKIYSSDFEIAFASDGEKGLKLIYELDPDIILLDIYMPGKDGHYVLKELKDNKNILRKIIIISGSTNGSALASEYGTAGSVWKPLDFSELRRLVNLIVKKNRMLVSRKK